MSNLSAVCLACHRSGYRLEAPEQLEMVLREIDAREILHVRSLAGG